MPKSRNLVMNTGQCTSIVLKHRFRVRRTFVEIQVVPPFHRRDISKPTSHRSDGLSLLLRQGFGAPHMCDFVALNSRNAFHRRNVGIFGIDKVISGPPGDQTLFVMRIHQSVQFTPAQG